MAPNTRLKHYICSFIFCRPKSDTRKECDALNVQITATSDPSEKQLLQSTLHLHHCKAQRAYQQLSEDTALSQSSPDVDTISTHPKALYQCSVLQETVRCRQLEFHLAGSGRSSWYSSWTRCTSGKTWCMKSKPETSLVLPTWAM